MHHSGLDFEYFISFFNPETRVVVSFTIDGTFFGYGEANTHTIDYLL